MFRQSGRAAASSPRRQAAIGPEPDSPLSVPIPTGFVTQANACLA